MKYLKNFLKVLIWPIIFIFGTFFIEYIFVAIFNIKEKGSLTNSEFLEYIKTVEYQNKLSSYINSKALFIAFITAVIFIPIFYKLFKKYKKENSFSIKDIGLPILFGITVSLIYNITMFNLNNLFYFTNNYEISNIPIIVEIICSGIVGIVHTNIVNGIYAFGVSFMFIYLYEKHRTLKAPIIMHMSLNITIILMLRLIIYVMISYYIILITDTMW